MWSKMLILTWNLHPYWLDFTVIEGTMYSTWEKSNHQTYPSVSPTCQSNDHFDKTCPKMPTVAQVLWE